MADEQIPQPDSVPGNSQPTFNLNDAVETYQEAEFKVEQVKNTAKRHMSWIALFVIFAVILGCFVVYFMQTFNIERFSAVKSTIETGLNCMAAIVAMYFGFSAFSNSIWAKSGTENNH